jgi:hypothetical protein
VELAESNRERFEFVGYSHQIDMGVLPINNQKSSFFFFFFFFFFFVVIPADLPQEEIRGFSSNNVIFVQWIPKSKNKIKK